MFIGAHPVVWMANRAGYFWSREPNTRVTKFEKKDTRLVTIVL